jgi:hypothetical protein
VSLLLAVSRRTWTTIDHVVLAERLHHRLDQGKDRGAPAGASTLAGNGNDVALGRICMGGSRPVACSTRTALSEPVIKAEPRAERSACFIACQLHK